MKKVLFIAITTLLFFTSHAKKIKLDPSEIQSLKFVIFEKGGDGSPVSFMKTKVLYNIKVIVTKNDGSVLETKKDGLAMNQFSIESIGAYREMLYGVSLGTIKVEPYQSDLYNKDGILGVFISCSHKKDENKKHELFFPIERPEVFHFSFYYNRRGQDVKVKVAVDSSVADYPLLVKIDVPENRDKNKVIRINPETESVRINICGFNGSSASSTPSKTWAPTNGGNGGDGQVTFIGKAKSYEDKITILNVGGKGGKGGYGYNSGMSGRDGTITIEYED